MIETRVDGLKHIAFGKVMNEDLKNVRVSPFARSETRYIRPIQINTGDLGSGIKEVVTLVDTPGLFDLGSPEIDVSNQLGIAKALAEANSVQPVIILSYLKFGARGENLKIILNFYAQMITEFD
jgi:hypothetical protein